MKYIYNWLWLLTAVMVWVACFYGQSRPSIASVNANTAEFSATRADNALSRLLKVETPHPVGSIQNDEVRARLSGELQRLNVRPLALNSIGCRLVERESTAICGIVHDILAEISPGMGPGILVMAHIDSVAVSPGASDDGSSVATILEVIRAWKAGGLTTQHPILALFTDGEEAGTLGANAFLSDPKWRNRIGIVINLEARGTGGRSFLFQTSHGDGALVNLYAKSARYLAASSLYAEIYKALPNDTDLTPFIHAGYLGYNFAFVGNVAQYHTPLDLHENLDLRSVQQHGESVLGLLKILAQTSYSDLRSGDAVYFDVLGFWLPRLSKSLALPLSILAFLGFLLAGIFARSPSQGLRERILSALAPAIFILLAGTGGFIAHGIASLISGNSDPSFAHPWATRLSHALIVWSVSLVCVWVQPRAVVAWAWISGLGVLAAVLLPGLSPYFLFPSLVAAILFAVSAGASARIRRVATGIAALVCMFTWLNLAATGEAIMGFAAYPLFCAAFAIALIPVVSEMNERYALRSAIGAGFVALLFAITAGIIPTFSHDAPQRLNLRYVEDNGEALWVADPLRHLPRALHDAGHFRDAVVSVPQVGRGYIGSAGAAVFPKPNAIVVKSGNNSAFFMRGAPKAAAMVLNFPSGKVRIVSLNGQRIWDLPPISRFICNTPDCSNARIGLTGSPSRFDLVEVDYGLPARGSKLLDERHKVAVPYGSGDQTLLINHISVPSP